MTKHCIEKKKSDLEHQRVFPDVSSLSNIWNMSDDESDEEYSISNNLTLYYENICSVMSSLWNRREEHFNTDDAVTGWMLYILTHIR